MKLKYYVISAALILSAHTLSAAEQTKETNKPQECPLLIRNNSGSPIWISHNQMLPEKISIYELEQSGAKVIQPYEIEAVHNATLFNVFSRAPQSNTRYQLSLTVIQRQCDPSNDEIPVDFTLLETGQADPARLIAINRAHEKNIPEGSYPLCPGGIMPELDDETDQWFCKVYRYSDVYEKFVDEYVPVVSYIYQWLPSSISTQWYIKNPQFYNWYHEYPEFYSHLKQYVAPWQTSEYEKWYNAQSAAIRNTAKKPEPIQVSCSAGFDDKKCPLGLPDNKIKTKAQSIHHAPQGTEVPPITIHSKERKKQELEDIVSAHHKELEGEPTPKNKEKKEHVKAAPGLKYYDRKTKQDAKPMAISRRSLISTQVGKQAIAL